MADLLYNLYIGKIEYRVNNNWKSQSLWFSQLTLNPNPKECHKIKQMQFLFDVSIT